MAYVVEVWVQEILEEHRAGGGERELRVADPADPGRWENQGGITLCSIRHTVYYLYTWRLTSCGFWGLPFALCLPAGRQALSAMLFLTPYTLHLTPD